MSRSGDADGAPPTANWRSPPVVTLLSTLLLVGAGWALATAVGVVDTAGATVAGAVAVGVLTRLAAADSYRPAAVAAATVVTLPAGGLAVAGTALVFLAQFAGSAPVGAVFVVAGLGVAALGATGLPGEPVASRGLSAAAAVALTATLLVGTAASLPALRAVAAAEAGVTVSLAPLSSFVDRLVTVVVTPGASPPPVGSLLAVAGLAAVTLAAASRRLPVVELLDDETEETAGAVAVYDATLAALDRGWAVVFLAGPVWAVNALAPELLWSRVPPGLTESLGAATAAPGIRAFAVGVVGAGLGVWGAVRLVRVAYRTRLGTRTVAVGYAAGTGVLVWLGWSQGGRLATTLVAAAAAELPASAAATLRTEFDAVVAYYGLGTVGLALVAACVAATATVTLALATGAVVGLAPGSGVGHGLAAAGLFTAGGVGLAVGAGPAPATGALVAAVAVWDLGTYGVELGREVGRRGHARGAVFVHLGGTLLVSAVAAVGAVAAVRAWTAVPFAPAAPASVVLVVVVLALVVFVSLLR
ncbi:hypothetical protein [Halobaculum sp. MBLA0143]|uniref:hypothetical protein n=1 Tax=Halobaculum sp. MBLA0143 TaxID=3079933 RepID=UPI00352671DA